MHIPSWALFEVSLLYMARDDFDSADLLTALDQLDSIRYTLASEDDIQPP